MRHVLKNAAPGMLAVMGLQFGYLMGGSILVEPVFTWPGTGILLGRAIVNRDVPVLQGAILSLALIFVATNLASTCCRRRSTRGCGAPDALADARSDRRCRARRRCGCRARPGYWGSVRPRLRRDPVTVLFALMLASSCCPRCSPRCWRRSTR